MLKSKSSAMETVAHADDHLTSGVCEDFGQDLSISNQTALRIVITVGSPASYTHAYHCQQQPPPPQKKISFNQ